MPTDIEKKIKLLSSSQQQKLLKLLINTTLKENKDGQDFTKPLKVLAEFLPEETVTPLLEEAMSTSSSSTSEEEDMLSDGDLQWFKIIDEYGNSNLSELISDIQIASSDEDVSIKDSSNENVKELFELLSRFNMDNVINVDDEHITDAITEDSTISEMLYSLGYRVACIETRPESIPYESICSIYSASKEILMVTIGADDNFIIAGSDIN